MSAQNSTGPHLLDLKAVAGLLRLPAEAVEALVAAGYLPARAGPGAEPGFAVADVEAFMDRRGPSTGTTDIREASLSAPAGHTNWAAEPTPADLLEALDRRSGEMAKRTYRAFAEVFPEAGEWSGEERARFVAQAGNRLEALLAVTAQGAEVDEALAEDLEAVGAGAAEGGASLSRLLTVLRLSRDVVVETAVRLAGGEGHQQELLSPLLTRLLPAMDRLTDALAGGWWSRVVEEERRARECHEHLVEHLPEGVYEVDLDARLTYANPSLGAMLGRPPVELVGRPLSDVLVPVEPSGSVAMLMADPPGERVRLELVIAGMRGAPRLVEVNALARRQEGELVGFQGVVRDLTAAPAATPGSSN